jgi:hypothetical protein
MPETAFGYLIVGTGILLVLALVFIVTTARGRRAAARPVPPPGVHMPNPSPLPVTLSVAAALIGAGLVFRPDDAVANWWLLVPGLLVLAYGAYGWVRAAGHEWREAERGSHDDTSGH